MKIGNGELINGDCLEVMKTIPDNSIDLVVTSPPYYNSTHKYQRGSGYHYSRDVGEPLYLIQDVLENIKNKLTKDGCICLNLCFSYGETGVMRPFDIINRARDKIGYFIIDTIIWHKNNPIPLKNRLTNAFEYIFVLGKSPLKKYNVKEYTHNVWQFPVCSTRLKHSAMYPEELSDRCINIFSNEYDIILDPFLGSGTTAISAEKLNRKWIGIELNEEYCKIAENRLNNWKGQKRLNE